MNQLQTEKAPLAAADRKQNFDVIVTHANQTALFKAQNHQASEWLHRRCSMTAENMTGDTEIRVHPRKCQSVIADLKAAGFLVAEGNEALC
jgi:hypothetical protein